MRRFPMFQKGLGCCAFWRSGNIEGDKVRPHGGAPWFPFLEGFARLVPFFCNWKDIEKRPLSQGAPALKSYLPKLGRAGFLGPALFPRARVSIGLPYLWRLLLKNGVSARKRSVKFRHLRTFSRKNHANFVQIALKSGQKWHENGQKKI